MRELTSLLNLKDCEYQNNNILDLCDEYVYINMNESCESLNVGIASSIIMYEINEKNKL